MFLAGLQILADRQNIDLKIRQIAHYLNHFFKRLPQPDHNAALGQHEGIHPFGVAERLHRPFVFVLRLNFAEQPRHGFDIVIQNLGLRIDNDL